jgi:hypothetical protein
VAKALTTAGDLTLAVKRNSAAYDWRACSTGFNIVSASLGLPAVMSPSTSISVLNFTSPKKRKASLGHI